MPDDTDGTLLQKISALVREQQQLYGHEQFSDHDQIRVEQIKIELDRCWDLVRQRDAQREFGNDPNDAAGGAIAAEADAVKLPTNTDRIAIKGA